MELRVNDYVRTNYGSISKIEMIDEDDKSFIVSHKGYIDTIDIINYSPNIIDLIEVGDYVNGKEVIDFMLENHKRKGIIVDADIWGFDIDEIKSIVTKEQFERMEYKIESEVN